MKIDLGPEVEAFREEVRTWIEENKVEGLGGGAGFGAFGSEAQREAYQEWVKRLREGRWICVSWPEEYGGRGISAVELAVLNEEFAAAGVPRVTMGMGESLVGPSIIVHGTDEQKKYFLPRIINGEDRYCQGFSEPNAGSDLASVQTKGTVSEDEIIVNGQKVWTSGAGAANMIFTLCRTDPEAPKHEGISYVLVPMKDNGIETRPLKQMTGGSGFSEVFFTDARAPMFNVIGGLNNGWRVAMTTLGNERGGSATTQHLRYQREVRDLIELTKKLGKNNDPVVRRNVAWAHTHVQLMRYNGLRLLAKMAQKREPGPESSVSKLFSTEYHQRLCEFVMDMLGPESVAVGGENGREAQRWQRSFMGSRGPTIYAGTSEVQRNIIGERVLGLPKEPQVDDKKQ